MSSFSACGFVLVGLNNNNNNNFGDVMQDEKNQVMTTNVWVEQVTSPLYCRSLQCRLNYR